MAKLEMIWPDAGEERIRSARDKLVVAGRALRALDFDERLARIARVLGNWTAPDSPWRRELFEQHRDASPLDPRTLAEGLDSALRAWSPEALEASARREIGSLLRWGNTRLAPFECVSVLCGGSIPMPTLSNVLFPLIVGSPVLLRETSDDPITGGLLARSMGESDELLGRCLEIVRFPSEDETALGAFLDSPCVVATGSDETLDSIRQRLSVDQRFVTYGHRFSVAVFGPEIMRTANEFERATQGLALDIARWDQGGCLSPVLLYLVGLDASERIAVATRLAQDLDALRTVCPRGPLSTSERARQATERAEARMRAAISREARVFEGDDSTVVLEADREARPAPLARFLRILPARSTADLGRLLAPFSRHLSSAAVAGFSDSENIVLFDTLSDSGISRITDPGRLQTPPIDWPHDGQPPLLPFARFLQASFS